MTEAVYFKDLQARLLGDLAKLRLVDSACEVKEPSGSKSHVKRFECRNVKASTNLHQLARKDRQKVKNRQDNQYDNNSYFASIYLSTKSKDRMDRDGDCFIRESSFASIANTFIAGNASIPKNMESPLIGEGFETNTHPPILKRSVEKVHTHSRYNIRNHHKFCRKHPDNRKSADKDSPKEQRSDLRKKDEVSTNYKKHTEAKQIIPSKITKCVRKEPTSIRNSALFLDYDTEEKVYRALLRQRSKELKEVERIPKKKLKVPTEKTAIRKKIEIKPMHYDVKCSAGPITPANVSVHHMIRDKEDFNVKSNVNAECRLDRSSNDAKIASIKLVKTKEDAIHKTPIKDLNNTEINGNDLDVDSDGENELMNLFNRHCIEYKTLKDSIEKRRQAKKLEEDPTRELKLPRKHSERIPAKKEYNEYENLSEIEKTLNLKKESSEKNVRKRRVTFERHNSLALQMNKKEQICRLSGTQNSYQTCIDSKDEYGSKPVIVQSTSTVKSKNENFSGHVLFSNGFGEIMKEQQTKVSKCQHRCVGVQTPIEILEKYDSHEINVGIDKKLGVHRQLNNNSEYQTLTHDGGYSGQDWVDFDRNKKRPLEKFHECWVAELKQAMKVIQNKMGHGNKTFDDLKSALMNVEKLSVGNYNGDEVPQWIKIGEELANTIHEIDKGQTSSDDSLLLNQIKNIKAVQKFPFTAASTPKNSSDYPGINQIDLPNLDSIKTFIHENETYEINIDEYLELKAIRPIIDNILKICLQNIDDTVKVMLDIGLISKHISKHKRSH